MAFTRKLLAIIAVNEPHLDHFAIEISKMMVFRRPFWVHTIQT